MGQKLIFLDIDGTILVPDEGVRKTVREGLQKARDNGNKIFISTGRPISGLPEELKDMEFDGVIASAGSDIWIQEKNVFRASLDTFLIQKACDLLDKLDAIYMLEGYGQVYVSGKGREVLLDQGIGPDDNPELVRWKKFFQRRKNVLDTSQWNPKDTPIPKVTFILWKQEDMELVQKELGEDFYIAFFHNFFEKLYNGELISKTENKGTAIRRAAEYLHASFEDTIAFGDSMNDYQMIEQAACGVVMGNGAEELKAIADRVCETVEEDGVIRELLRMGLI